MKKTPNKCLVFLDLETTGLNPETDQILEVGIVVTTPDLKWIDTPWVNVVFTPNASALIDSDFVRTMHASSGLLTATQTGGSLVEVETGAIRYLSSMNIAPGTATMAGFGPHFDRSFLRKHMPALEAYFDYRMVDVSTLRGIARRLVHEDIDARMRSLIGEPKHRAVADCVAAISELDFYYKFFLDPEGMRKTLQKDF